MRLCRIRLRVFGKHSIYNALAAASAATLCGVAPDHIVQALSSFTGARRRMEHRGNVGGAEIYDDYAHHPDEIAAAITAARGMMRAGRLFVLFESHYRVTVNGSNILSGFCI